MLKYLKVSVIERINTLCMRTYRFRCAFQLHACLPVCSWTHLRYPISPFSIYEWQQNLQVVVGIDATGNLLKTFHMLPSVLLILCLPPPPPSPIHSLPFAICSMSSKFDPERLNGPRSFAVCFLARKRRQLERRSWKTGGLVCVYSQSLLRCHGLDGRYLLLTPRLLHGSSPHGAPRNVLSSSCPSHSLLC